MFRYIFEVVDKLNEISLITNNDFEDSWLR